MYSETIHVHVDFYTQKNRIRKYVIFNRTKGSHKANAQGISPPIMCALRR